MAFLAYSPLSRGLLSDNLDPGRTFGKDDERYFLPRYQPDVYPLYVELAHRLQAWAAAHGHSLTQLAVAWALSKSGVSSVLVGAKTPGQVMALGAADGWRLTPAQTAEVEGIVASAGRGQARADGGMGSLPAGGTRRHGAAAAETIWRNYDQQQPSRQRPDLPLPRPDPGRDAAGA